MEKATPSGSESGDSSDTTVSAQQWQRLQELFEHLVDLAPDERAAWLETSEPDPELRKAALALVTADKDTGALLTRRMLTALHDSLGESPINGMQLGNYRLIEEIGSGGMGTVFLAERIDAEFDRRVAIKLIRGIATRDASQRLRRERQILANLSHPNIARLLDGGTSDAGQPYLVMEFIEGSNITDFCRERALERNQRLRLLQQVCRAVHYAHQRLVIHRDLKPANVLVRHDGTPALLDFGIAKLLDANASGQQTQTALPWFTPAYASPEQRRGEPVSTATDIYGLGSLLHELLTDTVPKPDAEGRLVAPSQLATAGNATRSDRELDIIVGTATHPDPERRYRSAEAVSEDIERYIRRRPIHAAPDTLAYRVAKFIRRNRLATAAVAAAIALSLVFTWRLARERDRAVQAEAKAVQESANTQQVVDYLIDLFKAAEPGQAGNKPIDPRGLIDRGRAQIDSRLADQPQQRARLLAALGKIYLELGAPDQAAETLIAAADLERANGNPSREAGDLADAGFALNVAERPGDAEAALRRGVTALDSISTTTPRGLLDPNVATRSALLATLGLAQARNGDPKGGAKNVTRAIEIATLSDGADSIRVAQHQSALGEVELRAGNLEAAESAAQRGIDILRAKVPEESPELISAIGFLTEVYEKQGRFDEGERLLRKMLEVRLRTLDPGSAWAITVRNNLAQAIQLQGRLLEAIALLRENEELMRNHGDVESPQYLIGVNNLASLMEQSGDYDASIRMFRIVLDRAQSAPNASADPHMATWRQNLGRSLMLAGRLDEAWPLLNKDIEGGSDATDVTIEKGRRLIHLAEWMRRSARPHEALQFVDQAEAMFATIFPPTHPRFGGTARMRGLILRDQDKLKQAESELRRAHEILAKGIGPDANSTLDSELQLADVLIARQQFDEARKLVQHVTALAPQRFVESSPTRQQLANLTGRLRDI